MFSFNTPLLTNNGQKGSTFQSHNPHTIKTADGSRWGVYTYTHNTDLDRRWQLVRSTDGVVWSIFDTDVTPIAENDPGIVADAVGNLYLFVADYSAESLTIRKYVAPNFAVQVLPSITVPGLVVEKTTVIYAPFANKFVFVDRAGNWLLIDTNGALVSQARPYQNGPLAVGQYPHLATDLIGNQELILLGWTSTPFNSKPSYDGMHLLFTLDHGQTFYNPAKADVPVTIPVAADGTDRQSFSLALPWDALAYGTSFQGTWLANVAQVGFISHTMYWSRYGMVYASYSPQVAANSPGIMRNSFSENFGGDKLHINSLDGFFFRSTYDGIIYAVGTDDREPAGMRHINMIRSADNGATWQDFAQSAQTFTAPYSVNGARSGDEMVGIFTDIVNPNADGPQNVYAFCMPVTFTSRS